MLNEPEGDFFDGILTHFGEEEKLFGAVTPPIFQNSLFVFDRSEQLLEALSGPFDGPHVYSKISNPTVDIVEKKLAALEGTERCKVTGGGVGAISIALNSELQSGSHVIVVASSYAPTRGYLRSMERFGVTHTLVEGSSVEEIADSIVPETCAIYLESPSSMIFRLQDVPAICKIAREKGITTLFDNTYNTPLHMRPAEFGVDVVLHSASKYLGGHSDINAGVICTDRKRMQQISSTGLNYYANMIHPFSAWLMLRGMRTLKLRLKRHEATANYVASWLESRPEVAAVYHISLESFRQRELYLKTMKGSGGLFAIELKNRSKEAALAFSNALKIFQRGISWGGFESLVVPANVVEGGESKWVVRLFCGLEDPHEMRADLEQALALVRG